MINKLKALIVHLPIVQMIRSHREERTRAEDEKHELLEHQHQLARRVHVVEWLSYPHTHSEPKTRHDH